MMKAVSKLLLVTLLTLSTACGLQGGDVPPDDTNTSGNTGDNKPKVEFGPPTLFSDFNGKTVCTDSIAIAGQVMPGATVYIHVSNGEGFGPYDTSGDGSFCLDTELTPNQLNTIRVVAHHPQDGREAETTITVRHATNCAGSNGSGDGNTTPTGPTVEEDNVAEGITAKIDTNGGKTEGSISKLTDGSPDSGIKLLSDGNPLDVVYGCTGQDEAEIRIMLNLGKPVNNPKIVLKWKGGTKDYGKDYYVMMSTSAGTDMPDKEGKETGEWVVFKHEKSGNGGEDVHQLQDSVQRVALVLMKNAASGCREGFQLQEIQVIEKISTDPTTPIESHTCAGAAY